MTIPTLTTPPSAPSRTNDTPGEFVTNADAFMSYMEGLPTELNTWLGEIILLESGLDFNATSATSNDVGTGSKSWNVGTGKAYQIGTNVFIAQTSDTGNRMTGLVTAYSAGSLTVNVTASEGSGSSITDWSIGIDVAADAFAGGTLTSLLTLVAAASGQESLVIPHGTAPSSPTNGSIWTTTSGVFARINGTTIHLAKLAGPSFSRPVSSSALQETPYTITDGASVDIDPANGGIQTWTLGANRTPTAANMASGDSVLLRIADGTAYSVTWSTIGVVWKGGSAPTLATSGYSLIELVKIGSTVYGAHVGDVAS